MQGVCYLKKLFSIGSLIVIDEFSSVRINGPYDLNTLGPEFVIVNCADYVLEVSGAGLLVEKLAEEVAVFSFDAIDEMKMTRIVAEDGLYES